MLTPLIRNMRGDVCIVSMTIEFDGKYSNDPESSSETKMIRAYNRQVLILLFTGSIANAAYPVAVGLLVGPDSNKQSSRDTPAPFSTYSKA